MANTLIGRLTPTNNMGGTLTNESRLTGQLGGVGAAVTYASLPDKPSINNVELVGNKTTSDLNISYNDLRDQPVIPDVGEIDERLDDLEGDMTSLGGRLTTAEGNITSLGGRVTTAEGNITTLQGDTSALDTRLTTAEGDITSLGGRVTTNEGNITSLSERVTTAEGNITTLQGDTSALDTRLTTAEGNITSLDGRVTTNEGNISDLQGDMLQAQSDITQLNSSLTIEELGTSNILTPVSGVTMNDRSCWKIGKFVYLNAVFTISNPTQSVNDLATYKSGYAPSSAYLCPVMSYATGNDAGASSLLNLRTNKVDVEHTGGKPYLVISVIYKVA